MVNMYNLWVLFFLTWGVLGINQMFHNICFLWVLFHHYVFTGITGQDENDLLFAAENILLEVQKDANTTKDPTYSKILSSILGLILGWAEKRLLAYHNSYYRSNIDIMQSVLSIAISAAKILAEDMSHEYSNKRREVDVAYSRVDSYIRSSLHNAFTQAS